MQGLWKSIVGTGGRKMTIIGIGAILGVIANFLQTGELNIELLVVSAMGLAGRDGGNGSDA